MGSGIMICWVNDRIRFDVKIKMDNILQKANIPLFHHSITEKIEPKPFL